MTIVELYSALRADPRLQKNWESNQPRVDRVFEAPMIVRCPREIATACVLAVKMRFTSSFHDADGDAKVDAYIESMSNKTHRSRVANLCKSSDHIARAAIIHSLRFYCDRTHAHRILRDPWPAEALERIAAAEPDRIISSIKPTNRYAGLCVSRLAALLLEKPSCVDASVLKKRLHSSEFPGLGCERADAIGIFGFRQAWPIMDNYLWRLLNRHGVLTAEEQEIPHKQYVRRRRVFEPYWKELLASNRHETGDEIAANLYLWADEAEKFGFTYIEC